MGDNEVIALNGVDLDIAEGEFVAIMGPSGSGKSTLMNMLGCLDVPTSGSYFLHGKDVSHMTDDEQSDIRNDRGGNFADAGIPGRMDCIDHSTSTTRLLELLATRGALRWHRVLTPDVRHFLWIFPAHWSAVIEEVAAVDDAAQHYVVDSWFVNNGEPAVILPLADWKKGAGPDV